MAETKRYEIYSMLDQLEELLEDMIMLQVTSREDVERRIVEINDQIDEIEDASS